MVVVEIQEEGKEQEQQQQQKQCVSCTECLRLVGEMKHHVEANHAASHVEVQKVVLRAWVECHYSRQPHAGDAQGVIPSAVPRTMLLGELNAFLISMGWTKLKTRSALYKEWFLREVMALSDEDIRKGRNWSLYYRDGFAPGGSVDNATAI